VAAAASQSSNPTLRRRLVIAALTLSLALNLCFVAGVVWTRLHLHPGAADAAERFREMAAQLDLDPQQRVGFERYFRAMRARVDLMHEEVEPLLADAWSEVAKPQADEAQVLRLFDQAADKRRAFQREATSQTLAFLATLSPQQRARFVELAREHRTSWTQRIHRGVSP